MVLLIVVTASKTDFMLLHTMCIKMHSYSMVFNKPAIEYWPDRCRERGHSDAQLCTVSGHYVTCMQIIQAFMQPSLGPGDPVSVSWRKPVWNRIYVGACTAHS